MRRFFSFWWLCARKAFWGNTPFANDWQWVFGSPLVSTFAGIALAGLGAIMPTVAKRLGATEMTTGISGLDSFFGALAAFVLTWLVSYFVKLLNAPVALFHEQKDRADKLDGSAPPKKLTAIKKQIAELKERYISAKPIERQVLDNLVDGLRAVQDVAVIFLSLTAETEALTKSSETTKRERLKHDTDYEKQRHIITNFANNLNCYSNRIEDFTNIIHHLAPTLFDCTSKFIEFTPLNTEQEYAAAGEFLAQIRGNVKSVDLCIEGVAGTAATIHANFRGVSHDLNVAADRTISVITKLAEAFEQYKMACEKIGFLMEKKLTDSKKKSP